MSDTAGRLLPVRGGKLRILWRSVSVFLLFYAFVMPSWIGDENLLILFPFFIGVFYLCFDAPPLAKSVTGMVFYAVLMPLNMMQDSAGGLEGMLDSDTLEGRCMRGIMYTGIALLVYGLTRKNSKPLALSSRLWIVCGLLILSPLMVVFSFSIWNGFGRWNMDYRQIRLAYTVLPFAMFSSVAVLVTLIALSRQQELEQSSRLANMRLLYYQDMQEREAQVRTMRHDLRNHFSALQGLLEQGEQEKALHYIAELVDSPALHGVSRVCENELANVVFSCKVEEMKRLGLEPDVLVALPEALAVADTDLCALLGNALDNAMEAAKDAQDKKILIRARADCGMLMLRVENSFHKEPAAEHGIFVTTKPHTKKHGFGIRGMQEIAARYGGTLETAVHEKRFELVACLPLVK